MRETDYRKRLLSLDAYRGFVMLAMVSAGLGFGAVLKNHPAESVACFDGTFLDGTWRWFWPRLVNQFSHVDWVGCTFWDLIQPSFFFLVGASMPFSYRNRVELAVSPSSLHFRAARRAVVLVALGVLLASQDTAGPREVRIAPVPAPAADTTAGNPAPSVADTVPVEVKQVMAGNEGIKFLFTNVLAQIGLGYLVLHLLMPYGQRAHLMVLGAIVFLSWLFFVGYQPSPEQTARVTGHLTENGFGPSEWSQFSGWHASFNKHLNSFAGFDRWFLNLFPGPDQPGPREWFIVNPGGYQTLNFFPSLINMVIGLMAGKTLLGAATWHRTVLKRFFGFGTLLILVVLVLDTTIWPEWVPHRELFRWSLCPSVKRVWTPAFALFSAGWTLIMMGVFYTIIEVWQRRKWCSPFAIVGMNSIAIYLMYQLSRNWILFMWEKVLTTFDAGCRTGIAHVFFDDGTFLFARTLQSLLVIGTLWSICWYMYRQRIFIKI